MEAPGIACASSSLAVLHFDGQLGFGSIDCFLDAIKKASAVSIWFYHCDGGSVSDALRIVGALRGRRVEATVVNHCGSAFTLIMAAADERRMIQGSRLMVHPPQVCCFGGFWHLVSYAFHLLGSQRHQWRILRRRCSFWTVAKWMILPGDHWLTDIQARGCGRSHRGKAQGSGKV